MKTNKEILDEFDELITDLVQIEMNSMDLVSAYNSKIRKKILQSLKDVEERVKAEIVEKVEEDLSYTGVLDNNEQRRGYEKAFAVIKCIINSIK